MKSTTLFTLLLLLFMSISFGASKPGRLAVLAIENTTNSNQSFVSNMPTMIVTELMQQTGEEIVERSRIDSAMSQLGVNESFSSDGSRKIGEWVGADRVLMGSFSKIESDYRLDLRVIEVSTGKILAASQATLRSEMSNLVPAAVANLSTGLAPKFRDPYASVDINSASSNVNRPLKKQGHLTIRHKIILSLLTEKAVPMQQVRIYLNRKLIGQSPVIKSVNEDYVLFDGPIEAGYHIIELEHGVVNRNGDWKRLFDIQPEPISTEIIPNGSREISYRMKVMSTSFKFENLLLK